MKYIYILSKVITKGIENLTFKCKENQSRPPGVWIQNQNKLPCKLGVTSWTWLKT